MAAGVTSVEDAANVPGTVHIGVTGHQALAADVAGWLDAELAKSLTRPGPIVGLSCLAAGADQVFARGVLDAGHVLKAVIPCAGYEATMGTAARREYDTLLRQASEIVQLEAPGPSADAFLAASRYLVDHADELVAIWDGRPAAGPGGTSDVVAYARAAGKPVSVLWPSWAGPHQP